MYKVLIVDDEPMIREGLRGVIQHHCPLFTGIHESRDGDEALSLAMEMMPDVVITDIQMPRLGGLEFIRQLKREHPEAVILIISGYDDFEYAQTGLKLGVKDYLLKPVDSLALAERLNEIAEELKKRHVFLQDMEQLQRKVRESRLLFRERFLHRLLSGALDGEQLRKQAEEAGVSLTASHYSVALVSLALKPEMDRSMEEAMVMAVADEVAMKNGPGIAEVHSLLDKDHEPVLVIGCRHPGADQSFRDLHRYLMNVGNALEKSAGLKVRVSAGNVHPLPEELRQAYLEAREAKLYHFTLNSQMIIHYEEISAVRRIPEPQSPSSPLLERLLMHIKLQEQEEAVGALRELLRQYLCVPGANPHWVKLKLMELTAALLQLMEEWGSGAALFFNEGEKDPYVVIRQVQNMEELQGWLERFIRRCMEEVGKVRRNKSATYIEKVKSYLETAISDSQLSISDVASRLFLNPNYLRQLFRQETGESFVLYVTRMRLERALELLKDPTLKIQDVAERVGFEEQRYFSSCFKKFFQFTPTEYRESLKEGGGEALGQD